ncbi:MAG: YdeI/OmpD-associated family protein [Candidatus Thermoplasmatota archaeon]|nr:YdeI/OmpD-associated family protein [Candidatus Thermoplasmatota archaeon]
MSENEIPAGIAHELPEDLRIALTSSEEVLALWKDLTPIARNEFICWIEDAKKPQTRTRRIRRTKEELLEGKRRPCCWAGCPHRIK